MSSCCIISEHQVSTALCGLWELYRDKPFGATDPLAFILQDSKLCRKEAYAKLHNRITYLSVEHFRSTLRDIENDANSNTVFFTLA